MNGELIISKTPKAYDWPNASCSKPGSDDWQKETLTNWELIEINEMLKVR